MRPLEGQYNSAQWLVLEVVDNQAFASLEALAVIEVEFSGGLFLDVKLLRVCRRSCDFNLC